MSNDDGDRGAKPRSTKFVKGKSGNPAGRPKGPIIKPTTPQTMAEFLDTTIAVTVNGEPTWMTTTEAVLKAIHNMRLAGNPAADKQWSKLMQEWGLADPAVVAARLANQRDEEEFWKSNEILSDQAGAPSATNCDRSEDLDRRPDNANREARQASSRDDAGAKDDRGERDGGRDHDRQDGTTSCRDDLIEI